jgi:hypothetical protein
MIGFQNTDVTSKDITKLKKFELVDLLLSIMSETDVIVEMYADDEDREQQRTAAVLSADDVFDHVEEAVKRSRMEADDELLDVSTL